MKLMEYVLEQESKERKDHDQEDGNDEVRKSYNEIAKIDNGKNPILLILDGRSGIDILGVEDNILVLQDNGLERFIFLIAIEHDVQSRWQWIIYSEFFAVTDNIRDFLLK